MCFLAEVCSEVECLRFNYIHEWLTSEAGLLVRVVVSTAAPEVLLNIHGEKLLKALEFQLPQPLCLYIYTSRGI